MQEIQDDHLTRPSMGAEGAANHVAPPLLQHVTVLGVCRDGQQDTGEVTPTALLTSRSAAPVWHRRYHARGVAGLEAAGGNHLHPAAHLDGEVLVCLAKDGIGAVVERSQGQNVAVSADQHVGGIQQVSRQFRRVDPSSSSIVLQYCVLRIAVLCLVERFSDLLNVDLICIMKSSREVSGSETSCPGKTRADLKMA